MATSKPVNSEYEQNTSDNIIQIGEFKYQFNLWLFNDQQQILPLNRSAIKQLTILDNIFNPFHSAVLILNTDEHVFERTDINYTFLGNGRDVIYVELMQALSDNNSDFTNEANRKLFALNFAFIVIGCNEVQIDGLTYKDKVYPLIDTNNFDTGKNEIMFIPQGAYSSMNAINSILNQHQSANHGDWCILDCERYTKTFNLLSLADIFAKNNDLVIEKINLKQLVANEADISGGTNVGLLKWVPCPVSFNDLSDIINHYTDHSNAKDVLALQTNIITTSDIKPDKAFAINIEQGFSEDVLTEFSRLYIDPFNKLFNNKKLIPIVKLTNLQINNKSSRHQPVDRPADHSNQITTIQKYNTMLFMDRVNIFTLKGSTSRKTGYFIDVTTETKPS